jgi:SanA protein
MLAWIRKRWVPYTYAASVLVFLFVLVCNLVVNLSAEGKLYDNPEDIPQQRAALVLGTSERLTNGEHNPFFDHRIEVAFALYKLKRVQVIIVSGDNRSVYYNEPAMMRKALLRLGVPDHAIWLDYGGTRTIDSIRRCRLVFGQTRCVVVSQRFHNQRALFLAQFVGLDAVACNAADVEGWAGMRVEAREIGAKVLAFWDLTGLTFFEGAPST